VLSLDNSDLALRPGMTATADITVEKVENAVLVPNAALRFTPPATQRQSTSSQSRGGSGLLRYLMPRRPRSANNVASEQVGPDGQRSVYVLQDGAPKKVRIKTGASDGSWTQVLDGPIEAGTALITDSVTQ
jgi:HlyD family secretion protein